jgi:hypothetical protein
MNTMKAMTATAITITTRMSPVDSAPCGRVPACRRCAEGSCATMPDMMISEMPLPMPREVICSPSHIRNMVPPVSVITVEITEEHAGIGDDVAGAFEPDGDAVGLERGQDHGEVAGVLVQRLAARLALLLQRLRAAATPSSSAG